MLDRYHHGFANNLNSTAPVPVLKILRSEESAGASAHIAIGLTSFGMNVSFHTCVGQDSEGEAVLGSLKSSAVNVENIISIPDRKTLTKIRFSEVGKVYLTGNRYSFRPIGVPMNH